MGKMNVNSVETKILVSLEKDGPASSVDLYRRIGISSILFHGRRSTLVKGGQIVKNEKGEWYITDLGQENLKNRLSGYPNGTGTRAKLRLSPQETSELTIVRETHPSLRYRKVASVLLKVADGFTQSAVAREMHCTTSYISRLVTDYRNRRLKALGIESVPKSKISVEVYLSRIDRHLEEANRLMRELKTLGTIR